MDSHTPLRLQLGLTNSIIVDLFAGGGGASTGIEAATGHPVKVAINHDAQAVSMHAINHPYTIHYCEDVREIEPDSVEPGTPISLLWASPDCKHFSKAKGGKPVSKRVRGLAWVVVQWAAARKPDIICLENVEEFITWGPLTKDGRPCPKRKGKTFEQFVGHLRSLGYKVEWKELRACDYGAPTIRKRFFLIARRDGKAIVWPKPTHGKKGSGLTPYRTAADIIDWSIPCPSIFERNRPLAENTLRRIARGIQRYVIDNAEPFIVEIANSSNPNGVSSVSDPLRTVTAMTKGGTFALASPTLIQTGYGEREGQSPRVPGLDKPLETVVAGGQKHALVSAFLAKHYGGVVGTTVDVPTGTVTTADHHSLVTAHITKFRTGATGSAIDEPLHTITAGGFQKREGGNGHAMGLVSACLMNMKGKSVGQKAEEPARTITAGAPHLAEVRAFLVKYFGTDQDPRLEQPLHTVTTKDRFGLVMVHGVEYQIVDIGMRMLSPRELYRAQGFTVSYIIDRTKDGKQLSKAAQVRMCGNSVSPVLAEVLVKANLSESSLFDVSANDKGKESVAA